MFESEKMQTGMLFPNPLFKLKQENAQYSTMSLQLNEVSIVSERPAHVLPGIPSNAKFWKM
jgi:hypothetical protein